MKKKFKNFLRHYGLSGIYLHTKIIISYLGLSGVYLLLWLIGNIIFIKTNYDAIEVSLNGVISFQITFFVLWWFDFIRRKSQRDQLTEINPDINKIRKEVRERDDNRCSRCGSSENVDFDHIVELKNGGPYSKKNMRLLCEKCKEQKRIQKGAYWS